MCHSSKVWKTNCVPPLKNFKKNSYNADSWTNLAVSFTWFLSFFGHEGEEPASRRKWPVAVERTKSFRRSSVSETVVLANWQLFTNSLARGRRRLSLHTVAGSQLYQPDSTASRFFHLRLPGQTIYTQAREGPTLLPRKCQSLIELCTVRKALICFLESMFKVAERCRRIKTRRRGEDGEGVSLPYPTRGSKGAPWTFPGRKWIWCILLVIEPF